MISQEELKRLEEGLDNLRYRANIAGADLSMLNMYENYIKEVFQSKMDQRLAEEVLAACQKERERVLLQIEEVKEAKAPQEKAIEESVTKAKDKVNKINNFTPQKSAIAGAFIGALGSIGSFANLMVRDARISKNTTSEYIETWHDVLSEYFDERTAANNLVYSGQDTYEDKMEVAYHFAEWGNPEYINIDDRLFKEEWLIRGDTPYTNLAYEVIMADTRVAENMDGYVNGVVNASHEFSADNWELFALPIGTVAAISALGMKYCLGKRQAKKIGKYISNQEDKLKQLIDDPELYDAKMRTDKDVVIAEQHLKQSQIHVADAFQYYNTYGKSILNDIENSVNPQNKNMRHRHLAKENAENRGAGHNDLIDRYADAAQRYYKNAIEIPGAVAEIGARTFGS
ncbi:MAG: hypothetical protein LBN07_02615 [Christensenellaceae bacterium]|jgi:hypothetical protein|nr:hypothetical protein [Christensenellaceae bacterium]